MTRRRRWGRQGAADRAARRPGGQRPVWKTSEVVAFAVVRYIVDHGLRFGDRLPLEAEMVEHYRVSRESLREALRLLEAQGIVSIGAAERRAGRGPGRIGESRPNDDPVLPARRGDVRGAVAGMAHARATGRRARGAEPRSRGRRRQARRALRTLRRRGSRDAYTGALEQPALLGHRSRRQSRARAR